MPLPRPAPGTVVGYAYLWADGAEAGRREGRKDRPCVAVVAAERQGPGARGADYPRGKDTARGVELPGKVKRHLGLGEAASWIVLDGFNDFVWPGPDLRPVSRRAPGVWSYGLLPVEVFRAVPDRLRAVLRRRRVARPR